MLKVTVTPETAVPDAVFTLPDMIGSLVWVTVTFTGLPAQPFAVTISVAVLDVSVGFA